MDWGVTQWLWLFPRAEGAEAGGWRFDIRHSLICGLGEIVQGFRPVGQSCNEATGRFYDRVRVLYPLVDVWMAAGRRRCIERINGEPPGDLLEIGVGPGRHLGGYRGHRVSAMDVSGAMVRESRRRCPACWVWQADGEASGLAAASFDVIVLFHVLSVTGDPERLMSEVHRLLRPGGRVFILNREARRRLNGPVGWVAAAISRGLRLRPGFRLADCESLRRFQVCDRWSYGPMGFFTGVVLEK